MNIVFGPIISRRFGISLGIDLSHQEKQCNFNCVYCELEARRAQDSQTKVTPLEVILNEIEQGLKLNTNIDVLTFSANGEPTLYPHLKELIIQTKEILKNYPTVKTLILSNGSKFQECSEALVHFDIVKFSLDSTNDLIFKRIDKPSKSLDLEKLKNGIVNFSRIFKGDLIAEILIVKNINDNLDALRDSANFLKTINIKRLDISTIDRPSSHSVLPVSNEKLYEIANIFEGLNVVVATRNSECLQVEKKDYSENEIFLLIKRRPLSISDSKILLSKSSLEILNKMIEKKSVKIRNVSSIDFYYVNE